MAGAAKAQTPGAAPGAAPAPTTTQAAPARPTDPYAGIGPGDRITGAPFAGRLFVSLMRVS